MQKQTFIYNFIIDRVTRGQTRKLIMTLHDDPRVERAIFETFQHTTMEAQLITTK